jgi:uncharacterized protein
MADSHVLVWRGVDAYRTELAEVLLYADRLQARGTQIGVEPVPYTLRYALDTGEDFITTRLTVDASGGEWSRRLDLLRSPSGEWTCSSDARGDPGLPQPGGDCASISEALDCDLGFSPLTNTMPILRERLLGAGEAREFVMAWVSVPDLGVHRSEQRYEPIDQATVRYVGRHREFTGELELDGRGFVVRYPELAERVDAKGES